MIRHGFSMSVVPIWRSRNVGFYIAYHTIAERLREHVLTFGHANDGELPVMAWCETTNASFDIPPSFSIGVDDVQGIMDGLWALGFRPKAMDRETSQHLEDMRALAFGKLGIAKPERGK